MELYSRTMYHFPFQFYIMYGVDTRLDLRGVCGSCWEGHRGWLRSYHTKARVLLTCERHPVASSSIVPCPTSQGKISDLLTAQHPHSLLYLSLCLSPISGYICKRGILLSIEFQPELPYSSSFHCLCPPESADHRESYRRLSPARVLHCSF